ncbi:MAG TPA: hypothetical protein VL979_11955 [Solirubrobacteraceae bacterium]|nr:hypothetical protein [Solirubrobacteraceae bacterium]
MTEAPPGVEGGRPPAGTHVHGTAPGAAPLARWLFAALVVACLAAFLLTQRLKHTPTVVQELDMTPFFSPFPSGHLKRAEISFKLEHAESVTVTIVDSAGDAVATLVRDYALPRYKTLSLRWNGHRGAARAYAYTRTRRGLPIVSPANRGPLAGAGEYRVRIALSHHSAVYSTQSVTLVAP